MAKIELKDMRLTRNEKDEIKETAIAPSTPKFPFGLRLHLEDDAIDKMGIDTLPVPGSKALIMAEVEIETASVVEDKEKKRRSMTLQITRLGMDATTSGPEKKSSRVDASGDGPPRASASEVLFGD